MKNFIVATVAIFFAFSFYSFCFSGAKNAADNAVQKASVTSVDKACKTNKELCKEL